MFGWQDFVVVDAAAIGPTVGGSSLIGTSAPRAWRLPECSRAGAAFGERLPLWSPEPLFSPLTSLATAPEGGGSEVTMQVRRSLSAKIRKVVGTRQEADQSAIRRRSMGR
jgi:hypothetical protein